VRFKLRDRQSAGGVIIKDLNSGDSAFLKTIIKNLNSGDSAFFENALLTADGCRAYLFSMRK
jgi:hypothetical protein